MCDILISLGIPFRLGASLVAQRVKRLPAMWETLLVAHLNHLGRFLDMQYLNLNTKDSDFKLFWNG